MEDEQHASDGKSHLPVELLADLDGRSLLALQPQAVHRVGQIDGLLCRHIPDKLHAPVKVGVDAEHLRRRRQRGSAEDAQ